MTSDGNKAIVRRLVDELWNRGREDAIDDLFGEELAEVVRAHHRELLSAFSNVEVTIDDIIAEGDEVAARLTVSATHDVGPFAGQPPTGRRVRYASFRFYLVENGRIVRTWAMQDRLGLLQQLGAVSEPPVEVEWADESRT